MSTPTQSQPRAAGAHTPTPWHYGGLTDMVTDGDNKPVCRIYGRPPTHEEAVANAAFIVRACNSHAATIAALEAAAQQLDFIVRALSIGQTVSITSTQNCAAMARAALTLAKS